MSAFKECHTETIYTEILALFIRAALSIQPFRRRRTRLRLLHLRRPRPRTRRLRSGPKPHHTPHHVKQRVPLPRNADPKIHLPHLRQRIVPDPDFLDVRRIMLCQLLEQITRSPRYRQQQKPEEVEQGQRGIDAHVGAGAGDFLDTEGFVVGAEAGGEEQEGFVCGAQVAG